MDASSDHCSRKFITASRSSARCTYLCLWHRYVSEVFCCHQRIFFTSSDILKQHCPQVILPPLLSATIFRGDYHCNYATPSVASLDHRSFFPSYELNLFTRGPMLCRKLPMQFDTDLDAAEKIDVTRWPRRFCVDRLFGLIGWLMRGWL